MTWVFKKQSTKRKAASPQTERNMSTGRKPNWDLCIKTDPDAPWYKIGAAWETEKGNLFIKIDEGETLKGTAMMFPHRDKPPGGSGGYRRPYPRKPAIDMDDPYRKPLPPEELARIRQEQAKKQSDYMEQRRVRLQPPPEAAPTTPVHESDEDAPPSWM